jgi:uncharacterized protein (DUF2252 family)
MIAARLMEKGVVLRELMPQDLKIEVDRLTDDEAMALAAYLGGVVGLAHGRQMDDSTRKSWQAEICSAYTGRLNTPAWLWSSVVELLSIHEAAYLHHCHRFVLSQAV